MNLSLNPSARTAGPPAALLIAGALAAGPAHAVPVFSTFGAFPAADFGGSGIPNDAVAASSKFVLDYDGGTAGMQKALVQVALTAHERFSNVDVTNDGFGTFEAQAGSNFGNPGGPPSSATEGATWNFGYYVSVEGIDGSSPVVSDFNVRLRYDFDPADPTQSGDLGVVDLGALDASLLLTPAPPQSVRQGSENLLFDYLETGIPGLVTPPSGVSTFDPDALGTYTFALEVDNQIDTSRVDTVAIDGRVVPEPASVALFAAGCLAVLRRRSVPGTLRVPGACAKGR